MNQTSILEKASVYVIDFGDARGVYIVRATVGNENGWTQHNNSAGYSKLTFSAAGKDDFIVEIYPSTNGAQRSRYTETGPYTHMTVDAVPHIGSIIVIGRE